MEDADKNVFGHWETTTSRHSQICSCTLNLTIVDDVSSVSVRLDTRDSMIRLREFQQVRDVMVKVSRNELRPFWLFSRIWAG